MRSVKQPRDDAGNVHTPDVLVQDVHDLAVETDATHVAAEVAVKWQMRWSS